jgi:hypothetical protein
LMFISERAPRLHSGEIARSRRLLATQRAFAGNRAAAQAEVAVDLHRIGLCEEATVAPCFVAPLYRGVSATRLKNLCRFGGLEADVLCQPPCVLVDVGLPSRRPGVNLPSAVADVGLPSSALRSGLRAALWG